MYCTRCGAQITDPNQKFCTVCGASLISDTKPTCPFCGAENEPGQLTCRACGTRMDSNATGGGWDSPSTAQPRPAELSMAWYKINIYFLLIAGAILNTVNGILYITGKIFDIMLLGVEGFSSEDIFAFYGDGYRTLCTVWGISMVAVAVLQLYTRSQLAAFKKNSYLLLCGVYAFAWLSNTVLTLIDANYVSLAKEIPYISALSTEISSLATSFAVSVFFIIVNYQYFKKREHMFCN